MRKRNILLAFALAVVTSLVWGGCSHEEPVTPDISVDPRDTITVPDGYLGDSASIRKLFADKFSDAATIGSVSDIYYMKWLVNGEAQETYKSSLHTSSADLRYEFVGQDWVRYVSECDGYAVSIPRSLDLEPDYTLPKYSQKFESDEITLRITAEHVTPYPATEYYYGIYTGEWLTRYIANKNFVSTRNGLSYYEQTVRDDETIIDGCSVTVFSIKATNLDKLYYKIALVRPLNQWSRFGLILFKTSGAKNLKSFETILKSFRLFSSFGTSKNFMPVQEPRPNPSWNAETAAYYQKLLTQDTFDFGAFRYSMPEDGADDYDYKWTNLTADKARLEEALGRPFELMPTYAALGWSTTTIDFPKTFAEHFAGGNGFNGKPVLQFTYQYTMDNNNVSSSNTTNCGTPMFDILRGKYDSYFRRFAADIKAYGKPVLFRLNNEMNSDWTSYCGMMTLVDPDIFIQTWRRLYDIFTKEGVDNCIWIFNPTAITCPYSNWGEDLAYYPGNDYVQILGVTNYEMGNTTPFTSFKDRYTDVYNKNCQVFGNIPWVIGEFACGCGGITTGEERRNVHEQAEWVKSMFDELINRPDYVKPIKAGVWFSTNDYDANGNSVNFLELDARNTETLEAFHDGFQRMYKN